MAQVFAFLGRYSFPAACYLLAAYFLFAFSRIVGVPPQQTLDTGSVTYPALALFLFVLPRASKLRLGKLLEYEARVREIKDDVSEFKGETRSALAAYSSVVSALSNTVSQTVNVFPTSAEAKAQAAQAQQDLDATLPTNRTAVEAELETFVELSGNDLNYALAKLRMQLEKELTRILGKKIEFQIKQDPSARYLSAGFLFREFAEKHPDFDRINTSFDYVLKICNAALHGQSIPEGYAREALSMGLRILKQLQDIPVS